MKRRTFSYQITGVAYNAKLRKPEHTIPEIKIPIPDKIGTLVFIFSVVYFFVRGFLVK